RGSTNSLSGAIDGVTLNLKKVTPEGETIVLDVARDEEAILRKAESFVSAYNMLAQQIASLGRYDAATRTAGPMLGDSLLRGIDTQLRRMLSEPVAGMQGRYRTLTNLGIEMTQEGTLKFDHAKFRQALADDPD